MHGILNFGRHLKNLRFSFKSNENTVFRQYLEGGILTTDAESNILYVKVILDLAHAVTKVDNTDFQ